VKQTLFNSLVILVTISGLANGQVPPCPAVGTQPTAEQRACLARELAKADSVLAVYVQETRQFMDSTTQFDAGQAAWRRYRDESCRAVAREWQTDSAVRPAAELACRIRTTRARTLDLWDDYVSHSNTSLRKPPE
jgi:uncharacterized protein YecT (DUF1311 family)